MPRSNAKLALIALASGGLVVGTAAHVRAEDGLSGFFRQFFGGPPAPAAQVAPAPLPAYEPIRRARPFARPKIARERTKARYASLPRAERDEPKPAGAVDEKALALAKTGDVGGALLRDETLRAGDIAILASGPKVFVGAAGSRHKPRDFEDAARSARLDRTTRKLLAAMVTPPGALPADEARKIMAKLRRGPAKDTVAVATEARAQSLRVVYPSNLQNARVRVQLTNN